MRVRQEYHVYFGLARRLGVCRIMLYLGLYVRVAGVRGRRHGC